MSMDDRKSRPAEEIREWIDNNDVLQHAISQGYTIPCSPEEVEHWWGVIQREYAANLRKHTVRLRDLRDKSGNYNLPALWLVLLRANIRRAVSKRLMARFVQAYYPCAGDDQQVRHLGALEDGWFILIKGSIVPESEEIRGADNLAIAPGSKFPSGYYVLVSMLTAHPDYRVLPPPSNDDLTDHGWKQLKLFYQIQGLECCAVCGHPCDSLQRGHLHPQHGVKADNIVPMCPSCNGKAKKGWLFKKESDGRVWPYGIYKASLMFEVLDCTDEPILVEVYHRLKDKYSK